MNDILEIAREVLTGARFTVRQLSTSAKGSDEAQGALAFENDTVIGFVISFDTVASLMANWQAASDDLILTQADLLGVAGQKAWNTYLVLLAREEPGFRETLALGQIEEDLEGMRKIARAGVTGLASARGALLPLLPFRAAPELEPIDMAAEVRARSSELDAEVVRAFLSRADQTVVLQIVEDAS